MDVISDRFMVAFMKDAQRAAAESDPRTREMRMGALTANGLARLATSELLDEDEQKRVAMLAVHLMARLQPEIRELATLQNGDGDHSGS
jgi:hypothetical protein